VEFRIPVGEIRFDCLSREFPIENLADTLKHGLMGHAVSFGSELVVFLPRIESATIFLLISHFILFERILQNINIILDRAQSSSLHRSPVGQRGAAEDFLEDAGKVIGVVVAEFGRDFFDTKRRGVEIMACGLHAEADVVIDR